ncbi:MAG: hypothetical protein KDD60_12965, partial [Bdellovibrionales bacterium]|nr:hypothetical protein [Bdellovibrionales bacterium]
LMLVGRFDYMSRGPLDNTHLRFFTVRAFKKLPHVLGVNPQSFRVGGTIVPLELMTPEWIWNNSFFQTLSQIRQSLANSLPGLFAYQFVTVFRVP